jgi:hypothetical protein
MQMAEGILDVTSGAHNCEPIESKGSKLRRKSYECPTAGQNVPNTSSPYLWTYADGTEYAAARIAGLFPLRFSLWHSRARMPRRELGENRISRDELALHFRRGRLIAPLSQ